MKRPEGFDAPAPAEKPAPERAPARVKPLRVIKPRAASPAPTAPASEPRPGKQRPARQQPTPRPQRSTDPSPAQAAQRELRQAERARKRAEKRELKRFTRRQRTQRMVWLTGLGVVGVLTALILVAVFSPLLALREIRIEGTSRLDPAQLVDAVDGQLGVPLALLDEARIRDELAQFSLIRSYTTELAPPGTLIVRVSERSPVGTIVRGAAFDLVDAAGVVIETSPTRVEGMPVIRVAGDDVESAAFASIAEVLLALPSDIRAQLDSITATTRDDVTLVFAGSNQRVEWGSADRSEHKARVLATLVAIHGGAGPGLYDVSAPGSAVFRAD